MNPITRPYYAHKQNGGILHPFHKTCLMKFYKHKKGLQLRFGPSHTIECPSCRKGITPQNMNNININNKNHKNNNRKNGVNVNSVNIEVRNTEVRNNTPAVPRDMVARRRDGSNASNEFRRSAELGRQRVREIDALRRLTIASIIVN
jgi:hypothetical protein